MFHVRDGWYFERTDNGGVRFFKQVDPKQTFGQPPYQVEFEMDGFAWASVVASVSSRGESDGRFYQALGFHGKPLPKPYADPNRVPTGSVGMVGATGATGPISSSSYTGSYKAPNTTNEGFSIDNPDSKDAIIYDNFEKMINDIKAYTQDYPGRIYPCDLPLSRMIGFIHDNGRHWACPFMAVKNSLDLDIKNYLSTQDGKLNFCKLLSNVEK